MTWRPVLEGADAARARAAIAAISTDLARREIHSASLIHGAAGVALLFGELARNGDDSWADRAGELLAHAVEILTNDHVPRPFLGHGLAGVGWVMQSLRDLVDVDAESLEAVDEGVLSFLSADDWPYPYWLWFGAVGLGVYGLERGSAEITRAAVRQLERSADHVQGGVTWWNNEAFDRQRDPSAAPRGWHNLGMPLGVAGAITFLSEARAAGTAVDSALITDAVRWLLARDRPQARPRFPMCVGLKVPADRIRNSWCYGDATIAIALARAGQVMGEPEWLARAHELALGVARGTSGDVVRIDETLCCGTAGRAHLLMRLAHAFDDAELFAAARRYHLETLDRVESRAPRRVELTVGSAGVAIALEAAIAAAAPRWDRLFLVALPER